ncbi:unnamed protein product [Closterium sp. NIES-54]
MQMIASHNSDVPCVFLGFPEDSSEFTFYHPPLHQFFDSRDGRFDESVPYYVMYPFRGLPVPPAPLFLTSAPPPAPPVQPPPPGPAPSGVSHATTPPSVAPQVQPPSLQSSSKPTADPAGAGPSSGGAGVGAEPVTAGDSSLRGAGVSGTGVSGAVPGNATTGGAPSAGPREPGTDPVTSGGAGFGGGASGSLESGPGANTALDTTPPLHPYPTRHKARICHAREEQLELEREERELERQQLELQRLEEQQQQQPEQEQPQQQPQQQQQPPPPPVSGLWTLGLPSPSPPSPPSPPVSGIPLPPPNPSQLFSLLLCPRCPLLFLTLGLRVALLVLNPRPLFPSLTFSALIASLSTPITDYYRTYHHVLFHALASLVTNPRASLSSIAAFTAAVTEFASTRCLDYATSLVAAPPTSPLALGDPDALDIPTPRTYAEAMSGHWASQWRAAMDSEMATYRSTGTYVRI